MRIDILAFTETEQRAAALRDAAGDHRLRRSRVSVHDGGLEVAARHLAGSESPHLLVLETGLHGDRLLEALDTLAHLVSPDSRVLILGTDNDIRLYRQLMGLGVSEYLFGEVRGSELAEAICGIFASDDDRSIARVVAVYGVRGGVGSSTVAANLAHALGKATGEDALLVDLDIWFGTAALMLNQAPRQTVAEALAQPERLDDQVLERFLAKYDDHLSLLAAPAQPYQPAEVDRAALDALMGLLRQSAPYVVVDLPHLWAPWVQDVILDANDLVLVAYPDLANLRDLRNIQDIIGEARGAEAPTRLVFNREGLSKKGELAAKDFEESVKLTPTAAIPFDAAAFGAAMNNGEPVAVAAPGSAAAKTFEALAWTVSGRARPGKKAGPGFLGKLLKKT